MKLKFHIVGLAVLSLAGSGTVMAQDSDAAIAAYRASLQDGNPAELWELKGEGLWKAKRGAKNVSLE